MGSLGLTGVAKNAEKYEVLDHPQGRPRWLRDPLGSLGRTGWQKMSKNARFLATPRAAKVAKGPLGTNGPHWGCQKCRKTQGFWPPQGRPRWLRDPLGSMGRTGMAKNVEKHNVFGHPKGGQGGQGTPWGPWAALGWPEMRKNARFLATPRRPRWLRGLCSSWVCILAREGWPKTPPQGGQGG